jgi:hypothetical protein
MTILATTCVQLIVLSFGNFLWKLWSKKKNNPLRED